MAEQGRPTKFNDDRMTAIINALANGSTRKDAAAAAGVTYQTLLNWLQDGEELAKGETNSEEQLFYFFYAVTRAEAECANAMALCLKDAAATDWRAAEAWLKRRRKEDWSERSETTGANGGPVEVEDVTSLTPELRAARALALLDAARARRDFDQLARSSGTGSIDT